MVWLLSSFFFFLFLLLVNVSYIFNNLKKIFTLITLFYFIIFFFLSFFLPVLLSWVVDRVLVLWPGVRPVPLRWKSRVQDIGPPDTSQLHVVSNVKALPEVSISVLTRSSTKGPASYSAGHPRPNN